MKGFEMESVTFTRGGYDFSRRTHFTITYFRPSKNGLWLKYLPPTTELAEALERCILDEEVLGKAYIVYERRLLAHEFGKVKPLWFALHKDHAEEIIKWL
jgi:hypothetical protein